MKTLTQETLANSGHGHSRDKASSIVLTVAVLIGIVYILTQGNQRSLYVLSNGLPPLLAFAALVLAAAGLIRNGVSVKNRISIVWLGYLLGVMFWLLGESTWAVFALWYSIPVPFPSIADGFWLVGYIPFLCAIVMQSWPFREFLSSKKMLIALSTMFLLAWLLLAALIPPTYASDVGQNLVSVAVGLAYPLLDVILLFISLPILFLYGRGTFWRPFLFVTVGLILTFLGDILFSWASLNRFYFDGSYLELFFHWAYLAMAYGFYLRFRSGSGTKMLEQY